MPSNGPEDPRLGRTSASNAEADGLCPGRHQAIKAAREALDKKPSPEAEFGTSIHAALAAQDPKGLEGDAVRTFELCQQVEASLLQRYFGADMQSATLKVWRHRRLWAKLGDYEHSGEPDVVYRVGSKALIIEYKTLYGEVPVASSNKQLRDQAVLFWLNSFLIEEIAVAVDQPAATLKPEICVYAHDELRRAHADITARIAGSNAPSAPRVAGEIQCAFCDAKVFCSEYQVWATNKLPLVGKYTEMPFMSWGSAEWTVFCDNYTVAQKWLDTAKTLAKERLQKDPKGIPGWFLTDGYHLYSITNPQECFNRFLKLGGTQEQFIECIKIMHVGLEKMVKTVTGAKGKGLEKVMADLLADIVSVSNTEGHLRKIKGDSL
jgi:hypothetical protein